MEADRMEKRLGKGLAQIIETSMTVGDSLVLLRTDQIKASRFQPRQEIETAALEELKTSIKRRGIIQPIVVRPIAHGIYELVAGERRWRAAQALGIQEVPSIVKALSDQETLEASIIENVQREELNALEEARAYQRLIEEFHHTQEQLGDIVGKDRSSIANTLRLLKLPKEIQQAVREARISEGHAKILVAVEPPAKQLELFQRAQTNKWSVRQLEEAAGQWQPRVARRKRIADPHVKALEQELRQRLGTKVTLAPRKRGGRLVIEYFSPEDLGRILSALGVSLAA